MYGVAGLFEGLYSATFDYFLKIFFFLNECLTWLSSVRFHPTADSEGTETHSQRVDGAWGLLMQSWGKDWDPNGIRTPLEDQQSQLAWTLVGLRD